MQQRRLRPGDVLDDYCPRERRVTDHAIVAMIDDEIKQTRCVSCDTEHEYKQAKVPAQRRKKAAPGLFTQVLDGLQGPARLAGGAASSTTSSTDFDEDVEMPTLVAPDALVTEDVDVESPAADVAAAATPHVTPADAAESPDADEDQPPPVVEEGPVRRPLIRAQLPRHEGQPPPTRDLPDFTVRQPGSGRASNRPNGAQGSRPGGGASGRRRPGGQQQGPSQGPARFAGGQGRGNQVGRPGERRHGAGQGPGQGHGQGQGQGQGRGGRPNRGGRRGGGGGSGRKP